jgi:hypothetical protein
MEAIGQIDRNDLPACRRFYIERRPLSFSQYGALMELQDDPAELEAIADAEGWKIDPLADKGLPDLPSIDAL